MEEDFGRRSEDGVPERWIKGRTWWMWGGFGSAWANLADRNLGEKGDFGSNLRGILKNIFRSFSVDFAVSVEINLV